MTIFSLSLSLSLSGIIWCATAHKVVVSHIYTDSLAPSPSRASLQSRKLRLQILDTQKEREHFDRGSVMEIYSLKWMVRKSREWAMDGSAMVSSLSFSINSQSFFDKFSRNFSSKEGGSYIYRDFPLSRMLPWNNEMLWILFTPLSSFHIINLISGPTLALETDILSVAVNSWLSLGGFFVMRNWVANDCFHTQSMTPGI